MYLLFMYLFLLFYQIQGLIFYYDTTTNNLINGIKSHLFTCFNMKTIYKKFMENMWIYSIYNGSPTSTSPDV